MGSQLVRVEVADLPPSFRMRGHGHASPHLCVVLNGGVSERHSGRSREWGGNWIRVSGAETDHDLRVIGPGGRCLILEFSPSLLPPSLDRPGSVFLEAPSVVRRLREELLPFAGDCSSVDLPPADSLAAEARLSEFLAQLSRVQRLGRETPPPRWLALVRDRLEAEATIAPELCALAKTVDVHPSHLARAFREHYGQTIGSYVRQRRLALAHAWLIDSEDSLGEIAARAGFADQAHFTRAFAERWGIPPGKYRHALRPRKIERMQTWFKTSETATRHRADAVAGTSASHL